MRVSLWQQFSSNNSSSYVIVGSFETEKQAQDAATAVRTAIQRMWEWYDAHPDERINAQSMDYPPTEAEMLVAKEYNIEFLESIDWIAEQNSADFIIDAVTTFENHVFIAVLNETLTEDTPFVQLVHRLGGEIKYEQALSTTLCVNIVGTAPDAPTADYIKTTAESYLIRNRDSNFIFTGHPPWAAFCDGQLVSDLEKFNLWVNHYLAHEQAQFAWMEANKVEQDELYKRLMDARRNRDQQAIETLERQSQLLRDEYNSIPTGLSADDFDHIEMVLDRVSAEEMFEKVEVIVDGLQVSIHKIWFFDRSLGHGLPAVITWMRALGCTNVSYEFFPWVGKITD